MVIFYKHKWLAALDRMLMIDVGPNQKAQRPQN